MKWTSRLVLLSLAAVAAASFSGSAHAAPRPARALVRASLVERAEAPPQRATRRPTLPRGGRSLFPRYRLVGFCGTPGAAALGRLRGNLTARTKELRAIADQYGTDDREIMPVFELIAVVVQSEPGPDGKWRRRVPTHVIDDYLRAAREAKGLLLLNIQPGHSDFLTELQELEPYLREPDVGVALDPEWAMRRNQTPGAFFGQTTGKSIDEVAAYLAKIVARHGLPEKALVYHQVNDHVVKAEEDLRSHPGVALVKSVDGLGRRGAKVTTFNALVKNKPASVHAGFKLFFDEDRSDGGRLMNPGEVLALDPTPTYVMYE